MNKKCDHCDQPAVVHVTRVENGKVQKVHYCEACAKKAGVTGTALSVTDTLLGGARPPRVRAGRQCGTCGMTLRRFQKEGRLGCPDCYIVFEPELDLLLRSIHDATQHCGRVPGLKGNGGRFLNLEQEVSRVEARLKTAVAEEAYEEAARLRDELAQLKEKQEEENKAWS